LAVELGLALRTVGLSLVLGTIVPVGTSWWSYGWIVILCAEDNMKQT